MTKRPISEDDLQGLVDERLDASRRSEVEAYLGDHPEARARVARMVALREDMRAAFAPIVAEPVPAQLNLTRIVEARRRSARPTWQAMAAGLMLLVGGAGGWGLREVVSPVPTGIEALAQEASTNYAVYAPDHTRPVELAAANRDELAGWFSNRLKRAVGVPDLSGSGYRLMGGRLVATPQGPAGMLMYPLRHADAAHGPARRRTDARAYLGGFERLRLGPGRAGLQPRGCRRPDCPAPAGQRDPSRHRESHLKVRHVPPERSHRC
jgi:anti-sigma factor RsiW